MSVALGVAGVVHGHVTLCWQVKRVRAVHQVNALDEVTVDQQQQPCLTIQLSASAPSSTPPPLGYQPPSSTVDTALAHHVTSAAAAACASRPGSAGKRLRVRHDQQVLHE
jgi:hypothetical protein